MNDAPMAEGRLAQIAFVVLLLLTWVCYQPATSGAFQLDDRSNLSELSRVDDFESGLNFSLSGSAGPLGRPIALATFAMQAESWAAGPAAFLRANILLHLLNATLLAFCVFRLSLLQSFERDRAMSVAVLVAGVWMLLPLLASASLLTVQRMTTLSATFMLLGLASYLVARARLTIKPAGAMVWMTVSLVVATALAMLSKESGLLLPVFVLVLEVTILQPPTSVAPRVWRSWVAIILGIPLLAILAYLASIVPYPEPLTLSRGFNGSERLMTQAGLLWVYLYKALVGTPESLGVFQDAPHVATSLWQWQTLLACLSWLVLGIAAVVWRRRWPLFALAVLWFLAGHLIESTVVSLQLYFEHRNYLPIIGPLLGLFSYVLSLGQKARQVTYGVTGVFMAYSAYSLLVFASLWGEPSMASRYWAMHYPDSVRAVTTLASFQLAEEGSVQAIETMDSFVSRHPQHAYLKIQQLNLLCRISPGSDHSEVVAQLQQQLPAVDFTLTAGTMLSQLFDAVVATECETATAETVAGLAVSLRNNPRYQNMPPYNQFHERLLAAIARQQGDTEAMFTHLRAAIGYQPSSELNFMMVTALASVGRFAEARKFMEDARLAAPMNPVRAAKWRRDLDELLVYIDELEKVTQ